MIDPDNPEGLLTAPYNVPLTVASEIKPSRNVMFNMRGRTLVTIDEDGKVTFAPDYTPDAAATAFWESLGELRPIAQLTKMQHEIDDLKEQLEKFRAAQG